MLLFGDTGSSLTFSYTSPHLPFRNAKAIVPSRFLLLHATFPLRNADTSSHLSLPPLRHSLFPTRVCRHRAPLPTSTYTSSPHLNSFYLNKKKKSHSPLTAPRPRRDPPPHLPTSPVPTQGYRQPPLHFPIHSSCPRVPCPHSGISTTPSPLTQHSHPHLPTHTPCYHSGISITSSPTLHSPLPSPSNHSSSPVFQ